MSVQTDTPSLHIKERAGRERTLVLSGRALPLKDGRISFGIKQRANTTFYSGNPIATRQVFGPTLDDTSINGKWSDRWLGDVTEDGIGVTPQALAMIDGQQIGSLQDLDTFFEELCGSGIELEVSWAHKLRIGTLEAYEGRWQTTHDLEWSMNFQWLSRGDSSEPMVLNFLTPEDSTALWDDNKSALKKAADPGALQVVSDLLEKVEDGLAEVTGAIDEYTEIVTQAVDQGMSVVERVVALATALDGIRSSAQKAIDSIATQIDRRATAIVATAESIGTNIEAQVWLTDYRGSLKDCEAQAAQQQRDIAQQSDQRLQNIYIAADGDDLREVSTAEYGTPNEWRRLMTFNGLTSSRLSAGQAVLVPDLGGMSQ